MKHLYHLRMSKLLLLSIIFVGFLFSTESISQSLPSDQDSIRTESIDSLTSIVQESGTKAAMDSLFVRNDSSLNRSAPRLGRVLSSLVTNAKSYSIELGKLRLILLSKPDFSPLDERIPQLRNIALDLEVVIEDNKDVANSRFLNGVENFMTYYETEKELFDVVINKRMNELLDVGERLDQVSQDTLMRLSLRDNSLLPEIAEELTRLQTAISEIEEMLIEQELDIASYQARLGELSIQFMNLRQFFRANERAVQRRSWSKEANYLWEPRSYENIRNFGEIARESFSTNIFILTRFVRLHQPYLLASLAFLLIIYVFTKSVIQKVKKQKEFADQILGRVSFLQKHLLICCTIIVIPLTYVFLNNPSIVFSSVVSFFFVALCTWVVKDRFPAQIYKLWLFFFPVYLLAPTFGLIWGLNYDERYLSLFVALAGIALGWLTFRETTKRKFAGSTLLYYLSIFLLLASIFSLGLNAFGRVSLAKTYGIAGVANFYRGIALYLFVQVILKLVYLWLEASKKEADVLTSFFDFQEIQQRLEGLLSIFAGGLWFYSITYYLGFFTPIYEALQSFLIEPRQIGNLQFEFSSILLFILIILLSAFLANNIAYFASLLDSRGSRTRKQKLGSSVLLIRLAVIIIGFFIAMAAAKIPFDKITIVLGALSVGIGFGLQTIINNLVSGIILAFERPIQIGDDIQIGDKLGVVQEVGIRASKIRAYDGSEIVMPNGDLLSQSLINWTLSDKHRRIELIIGVAYSSDMQLVNKVFKDVLNREKILKNPEPKVLMQNFGDNSVDFRLLFWVENMDIWIDLRSEVMNSIFEGFVEHNIEIPFPQRDLYLKSFPGDLKNIAQAVEVKEAIQSPKEVKKENEKDSDATDENKKPSED